MNIGIRFLLAVNQSTCLIITGQNDFTISAWSYVRAIRQNKTGFKKFVDWLFFWQEEHCKNALIWELQEASKLIRDYRAEYDIARYK